MKISIIMPVYNKEKYVRTILQQLKDQSFKDFECIIVDDGSTDVSGQICDEFANIDRRFKVFHIPNGGVSHARNVGLEKASGEFITFIDADDEILPNYLENLYRCIKNSNADIVISGHQKFWEDKADVKLVKHPTLSGIISLQNSLESFVKVQCETGLYGWCWAKIFRRSLMGTICFDENLKLAEDLDFYLKLYKNVRWIYYDDQYLYRYRQEAENSSMLGSDSSIDYFAQLKIQQKLYAFLKSENMLTKDNYTVQINRIYDYVYFCLFHSKISDLKNKCIMIRELELPSRVKRDSEKLFKRFLLFFFCKKMDWMLIFQLSLYRFFREISFKLRKT